jgi:hypothetical protein
MANFKPSTNYAYPFPAGEAHSLNLKAFDDAIRSQGVSMVHYRAMACPQGMIDRDDTVRRNHVDHDGCNLGYLYKQMGTVTALFTGNSVGHQNLDMGAIDGSTAQMTLPRFYDGTDTQVYLNYADRFYMAEENVLVPHWEIFEHNISGFDRLRWPLAQVQNLIDNRLVEYTAGVDFELANGQIHWLGNKRPGIDPDSGKGRICTAWYLYRPYFYVQRISHEVRVVQTMDALGNRSVQRAPYQITVVRETQFENKQNNTEDTSTSDPRELPGPREGSFGPR